MTPVTPDPPERFRERFLSRNVVRRGYRPGMTELTGRPRRFDVLITLPCAGPDPFAPASIVTAIEQAAIMAPAGKVMAACTASATIVSMVAVAIDADSAARVAEEIVRDALGVEALKVAEVNALGPWRRPGTPPGAGCGSPASAAASGAGGPDNAPASCDGRGPVRLLRLV
jgi:hypothetical protein